jgi:hypothetical protein
MKGALKRMVHGEEFKKWAYGTEIKKAQAKADKKASEVYTAIPCGEVESLLHTRLFGEYRSDKIPFAKVLPTHRAPTVYGPSLHITGGLLKLA